MEVEILPGKRRRITQLENVKKEVVLRMRRRVVGGEFPTSTIYFYILTSMVPCGCAGVRVTLVFIHFLKLLVFFLLMKYYLLLIMKYY